MSGLFGTFNIAKSGLYAQQEALNVTSHNIANASTDGYTRQKVNLQTTTPENSLGAGQLGTGVQVGSITRVKDDFLDYQTRVENGTQGMYTSKDQFLSEVESIMNEPTDTGISSLIGKFYDSWQQLAKQPGDSASRQVVVQQSLALTDELNHTYTELQKIKTNTQSTINSTVTDINSLLSQISAVNQQIVQVNVSKQQPNDLLDTRDKLLNELSSDLGINIDKKGFEGINVTVTDGSGGTVNLVQAVNPDTASTLSYVIGITKIDDSGNYKVDYYKKGDKNDPATMNVNLTAEQFKTLNQGRVLLTDASGVAKTDGTELLGNSTGSLQGYSSVQDDVDASIDQLNKFAKALAFSVNAVETQSTSCNVNGSVTGTPFFVKKDADISESNENAINAGNITLNVAILNNSTLINTGKNNDITLNGADDGTRALAIAGLQNSLMNVQGITDASTRSNFLSFSLPDSTGVSTVTNSADGVTTDSYFNDVVDNIGIKEQKAKRMVQNQATLLASFQQSKDSISGVSLDEEMSNLVQYQHSYQANAKIISTIDQLLDVVINGLKK